jgi:hypothetical protein
MYVSNIIHGILQTGSTSDGYVPYGGTNPPGSNFRFDVGVAYLRLIILSVVGDVPVDSETLFDRLHESQDQVNPVFR